MVNKTVYNHTVKNKIVNKTTVKNNIVNNKTVTNRNKKTMNKQKIKNHRQ